MKLKYIKIKGYKNLDFEMTFPDDGVAVFIGNNGSGKSNVLEVISLIFGYYFDNNLFEKPNFEYVIRYEKDGENIVLTRSKDAIDLNKLPENIICYYSGEEARLWNDIYKKFYEKENQKFISGNSFPMLPKLLFLNKYYWKITLIISILKDISFNNLDTNNAKYQIVKNSNNITKWQTNVISQFIQNLQDSGLIKNLNYENLEDLFLKLYFSFMPKQSKFIDDIIITDIQKDGIRLNFLDLSEGEKRLILYSFIVKFLMTQDSLVLFDEIDNNIHPANKKIFKEMLLEEFDNLDKNIIFTTHSPILTTIFEDKNLFMFDNGNIINSESNKRAIVSRLTENNWSYFEINELLTTNEDIVIVEGSSDILYLEETLRIFKNDGEFRDLYLKFIPAGGANNDMEFFIEKLMLKENQKMFVLLDNDEAGNKSYDNLISKYNSRSNLYILKLPKPSENFTENNWEIEDFFDKRLIKKIAKENFKNQIENNLASFPKLGKNNISKSSIKGTIRDEFNKFKKNQNSLVKKWHLSKFKKIFEMIEQIKNESS